MWSILLSDLSLIPLGRGSEWTAAWCWAACQVKSQHKVLLRSIPHRETVSEELCSTLLCRKAQGMSNCQYSSLFLYHDGVRSGFYQSNANPMFKYWYICMLVGQNFSGFFLYFHTSSVFYMQTSLIGTLKFEIILLCCFSTSLFHVALPCSFSLPMSVSHNWQKGIDWQLEGNTPMATVCNALQAVVKIKYAWSILTIYHM